MSEEHPVPEPSAATQELQAEIALTRERVASEVDAITERIKPENIKRQVIRSVQDRAIAALSLARRNPVPTVLVFGACLGLLIWRHRAKSA